MFQPPPSPLSAADYDAIEAAVLETARGRWFLAEYARRNRQADTAVLLSAIGRLESALRTESMAPAARVHSGLVDMAEAIARTKADIAALKPERGQGRIEEATEELDSVVTTTESATSEILAAAEQIQEIAWTMREANVDAAHCDALDARAVDIYTACSFQDLTGQRTRKVINVLRYLESRLEAMIDAWNGKAPPVGSAESTDDRALLNGPALPGQGLGQADVDLMMIEQVMLPLDEDELRERRRGSAAYSAPASHAPSIHSDALAPLAALSYEEKIALFT